MEIFSSSDKLENIDFLFQKQELFSDFTNFLKNELIPNSENLKISQEIVNILTDVFEKKMRKNGSEFGFLSEYLEDKGNKKKMDDIFASLRKLIEGMKPKNVDVMKQTFLNLFSNNETKN